MSFPKFQRTAVTDAGDVIAGATITVRHQTTGLIVDPIYSDQGVTTKSNPFNTLNDGFIEFFVPPGEYRVEVVGGAGSIEWANVLLGGTSSIKDTGTGSGQIPLVDDTVIALDSVADLEGFAGFDGQQIQIASWQPTLNTGGRTLKWDSAKLKSDHDGLSVLSPTVPVPIDFAIDAQVDDYMAGVGETDPSGAGCWICISVNGTSNECAPAFYPYLGA